MQGLVSALYWLFVTIVAATMFPIAVLVFALTSAFDPRRVLLHRFTTLWASLYTWCNPLWRTTVIGRARIDPHRAYVMVANHLSLVDIFALYRLDTHFKWVSKIENFRLPFIGWNMWLNGYVPLRRGDRDSVVAMLTACERLLRAGNSIMMFPEGTRSKTGELRPFKPGAFELALRTGAPILPILVDGTFTALPKHGFRIGRAQLHVEVLPPIEVDPEHDDAEGLCERTRARIAEAQARLRRS